MYARVWKLDVLPERLDEFITACRESGGLVRKHRGFCGSMVVRGGPRDAPECTIVSVWDSLENLRASEDEGFHQAVARVLACCKPGTALQEEDVLICDFAADEKLPGQKSKAQKPSKRAVKNKVAKKRVSRRAS